MNGVLVEVCRKCENIYSLKRLEVESEESKKRFVIRTSGFSVVVEIHLGICDECLINETSNNAETIP